MSASVGGVGEEGIIMYPLWPSERKKIKIYMQSSACTYAHAHTYCTHGGFVHLSIHAETFVQLPNYSSVKICPI